MEPQFVADWTSQHIPSWEKILTPFAGKPSLEFLEIGSFEGRSACWFLQNILTHATSRLTCIDLFYLGEEHFDILRNFPVPGVIPESVPMEEHFDHNIRAIGAEQKVRKMKGKSDEVLRTLPLRSYDLIYIDASHTSRGILTDMVLSWGLLKHDGWMIIDDYLWNCYPHEPLKNPTMGIDAFLTVFAGEYEIILKDYQVIMCKTTDITSAPIL